MGEGIKRNKKEKIDAIHAIAILKLKRKAGFELLDPKIPHVNACLSNLTKARLCERQLHTQATKKKTLLYGPGRLIFSTLGESFFF